MTGAFYGVSVGPGDPELITVKASKLIASSGAVIAYPADQDGASLARAIAARYIPDGTEELPIYLPMMSAREPAKAAYDDAAAHIDRILNTGRDVVFLCEGDCLLYASFMYLLQRLESKHKTICIPGVTSLTASAAVIGRPLAARDDIFKVLPAGLDDDVLAREIRSADAVAIIKVGRHFDRIHRVITDLGLIDQATLVQRATWENQDVTPMAKAPAGATRPYFSMVLIHKDTQAW